MGILRHAWAWYERTERFLSGRPLATWIAISTATGLWTTGTLASLVASLAAASAILGSLVVALFIGSGIVGAIGQWLAIHAVAYVAALVAGLPLLGVAARFREARRSSIALSVVGLSLMLLIRGAGAVWAFEVVADLPRWAAVAWVASSFSLSVTLRLRESRKRTRRHVASVIPDGWVDVETPLFSAARPPEWTYVEMDASDPGLGEEAAASGLPDEYAAQLRSFGAEHENATAAYLLLNDDPLFTTSISYLIPCERTSLSQPAWDAGYRREFDRQHIPHRVVGTVRMAGWDHEIHEVHILPGLVSYRVHLVDPGGCGFAISLIQRDATASRLEVFKSFLGAVAFP
jgi:hypothetical protein